MISFSIGDSALGASARRKPLKKRQPYVYIYCIGIYGALDVAEGHKQLFEDATGAGGAGAADGMLPPGRCPERYSIPSHIPLYTSCTYITANDISGPEPPSQP